MNIKRERHQHPAPWTSLEVNAATAPDDWSNWIGRTESVRQNVNPQTVAALAATLDSQHAPAAGEPLPAGWQWLFFNPFAPAADLGVDGHPRRDLAASFLPPVPLPRRMWAGSQVQYIAPLHIGGEAERESRILRVEPKQGSTGQMCFVTVKHTVRATDGGTCIIEQQDIVYREAVATGTAPAPKRASVDEAGLWTWRKPMRASSTLLFRYSALTSNSHRIHYDLPYARDIEGYAGLVVHGPLSATLLQEFASSLRPGAVVSSFDFRGLSPLFADEEFELQARTDPGNASKLLLQITSSEGRLVMQATAGWRIA